MYTQYTVRWWGFRNKNGTTKCPIWNIYFDIKSENEMQKRIAIRLKYNTSMVGWLVGWFVSVRGQTELTCAKMHQQIIYYAKHRGFCYLPVRLSRLRLSQFFNFRNTCTCVYCTYTFIDRWMQTGQSNKNNNDGDGQWPWWQWNEKKLTKQSNAKLRNVVACIIISWTYLLGLIIYLNLLLCFSMI